jgi:autotransporter-associated beta strand protein
MQMRINVRETTVTSAAVGLMAIGISLRGVSSARASQVEIGAEQDATLLGGTDATTNNSLADPGIFVGTDGDGNPKRGLIEFNIAGAVPAGATITRVQLQLTVGQVAGSGGGGTGGTDAPETISLYDETQPWGQPTNVAGAITFGGHGHGAMPDPGDATWNYSFYNTALWTEAGGDWTSSLPDLADASMTGTLTGFTWSSAAMVTDVQNWLNHPTANFGWIIKNADETDPRTFRAFWSAQGAAANNNPAIAPELTVTYVPAPPATAYWSGAQSGPAGLVWSTELGSSSSPNTNWSATDGGTDLHEIPGGGVTNVIFGATGNSAGTLSTTFGADFSINSLTFASARTNSVIIGGASSLTILSGGISVQSGSGAHTINATGDTSAGMPGVVLGASQTWTNNSSNMLTVQSSIGDAGAGNSLTIAGSGVIELAGANTYTGGTTVSSGTLVAGVDNAIPSNSALSIGPAGAVVLAANTGLATLSSLNITGGGTLDITNNHVIIDYATGTQAAVDAAIRGYLIAGRSGGTWTGTGGIISSIAALPANSHYAIGYADGADHVVAGLSSGQIEVKYTLLGDADLDGSVTGSDFTALVGNLGKSGRVWDQGDFDYDGAVTGSDFTDLIQNLGRSASGADVVLPAADYAAIDAFAAANGLMADVPEPGTLLLIAVGMPISLRLRRRRQVNGARTRASWSI